MFRRHTREKRKSLESKILNDADRADVFGVIRGNINSSKYSYRDIMFF